jgi:hypothetical protein
MKSQHIVVFHEPIELFRERATDIRRSVKKTFDDRIIWRSLKHALYEMHIHTVFLDVSCNVAFARLRASREHEVRATHTQRRQKVTRRCHATIAKLGFPRFISI